MTKAANQVKTVRKRYSVQYKAEALALVERIGVNAATTQLGVHAWQLHAWRANARRCQIQSEAQRQMTLENVRLKHQLADQAEELAILKKAAAYFARGLK
jgi:transposase